MPEKMIPPPAPVRLRRTAKPMVSNLSDAVGFGFATAPMVGQTMQRREAQVVG